MCGKLIDHDCWECCVASEDGRGYCNAHHPLTRKVDLGVAMLRKSVGVDGESSFSGESDSEAEVSNLR